MKAFPPPRFFAAFAVMLLALGGCASHPTVLERPYTDAEIRQLALERLNRSHLPYEDYEKQRQALLAPSSRLSDVPESLDAQG